MPRDNQYDEKYTIRELTGHDDLERSISIINNSFQTVAEQYALTRENCPSHPAFMEITALRSLKDKGASLFGLFHEDSQAGFVAVEEEKDGIFYMEKLAVMPTWRNRGCGAALVGFIIDFVSNRKGRILSIGMIDKDQGLKQWYRGFGFRETMKKDFPRLPFRVCFMEREI